MAHLTKLQLTSVQWNSGTLSSVLVGLLCITLLRRFLLNVQAISAKIKLPKNNSARLHFVYHKLPIFQLKSCFMSVQNKMVSVFPHYFTRFDIYFHENA